MGQGIKDFACFVFLNAAGFKDDRHRPKTNLLHDRITYQQSFVLGPESNKMRAAVVENLFSHSSLGLLNTLFRSMHHTEMFVNQILHIPSYCLLYVFIRTSYNTRQKFALKKEKAIFDETLENRQPSTRLTPESQTSTWNSSSKTYG